MKKKEMKINFKKFDKTIEDLSNIKLKTRPTTKRKQEVNLKLLLTLLLIIIVLFFLCFIAHYSYILLHGAGDLRSYATDVVKETIRGGREFITGLGTTIIGYLIGRNVNKEDKKD